MRLIDADTCPCNECSKFCDKNCCDEFVRWLKGCDYNIDKVVQQLKVSSWLYCEEYNQRENKLYLFDAIDIVKGNKND